ncbi:hypothetical protein, partial [Methylobacterium radiotolerans]|uniref:hypothetical protein n=1 Tax=Methylobacterium radiotolerans TaxID=31998 RepID=UPI001AD83D7A
RFQVRLQHPPGSIAIPATQPRLRPLPDGLLESRAIDTYRLLKAENIEILSPIEQANHRYSDIDMGDAIYLTKTW